MKAVEPLTNPAKIKDINPPRTAIKQHIFRINFNFVNTISKIFAISCK